MTQLIDWWVSDGFPATTYTTNQWGFRDREFVSMKSPGTVRVAVLGDSFIEAVELEANERFTTLLERRFQQEGRLVEVWSLGIGDQGTAQQYLLLRQQIRRIQPDLVVLAMFPLNDVVNNSRRFAGDNESPSDHLRPYFLLDERRRLRRADWQPIRSALRRHSLLFAHAEYAWFTRSAARLARAGTPREERTRQAHRNRREFPLLEYHVLLEETRDPAWSEAWQVTAALIVEMQHVTQRVGADFAVVLLPCREEYDATALRDLDHRMQQITGHHDRWRMASLSRRLQQTLHQRGVWCVPLQRPFRRAFLQHGYDVERGGHFSPLGHEVIADTLYPLLERWLEGRFRQSV